MMTQETLLLTGGEVAAQLKISRALAYRWMKSGVLPTIRIPGARTVRVPRQALLEWIERKTRDEPKPSRKADYATKRGEHGAKRTHPNHRRRGE